VWLYCFRRFYPLIQEAVRSAWLRDVRSLNGDLLGETQDLREFLFGAETTTLAAAKSVLIDLQRAKCFYCAGALKGGDAHVDHFIPWSKYLIDLGHNFVLADIRCNGRKRDRIAHVDHLARWCERNREYGNQIATALNEQIVYELPSANRIAYWAYEQTKTANGLTWLRGD
jgi:5-methylcytosine-specific restriction endonuclease McrA